MRIGIIVAFPKEQTALSIRQVLRRAGYEEIRVCLGAAELKSEAERQGGGIIVSNYRFRDGMAEEVFADLYPLYRMLVVGSQDKVSMREADGLHFLTTPLQTEALLRSVDEICEAYRLYKKYAPHVRRERSDEAQAVLNEAKRLLMEQRHMSEDEAHRLIQKSSMDTGVSLREAAEKIIILGGTLR